MRFLHAAYKLCEEVFSCDFIGARKLVNLLVFLQHLELRRFNDKSSPHNAPALPITSLAESVVLQCKANEFEIACRIYFKVESFVIRLGWALSDVGIRTVVVPKHQKFTATIDC